MVAEVKDRAHRQAKTFHGFHDLRYFGESVGRKRDDDFIDVVAAHPFGDLLKRIYRRIIDGNDLAGKAHVTHHPAKGQRAAN